MAHQYEEVGAQINAFVAEGEEAALSLARRHALPIEFDHVQNALMEILALHDCTDLLSGQMTYTDILVRLSEYNFRRFFPEVIAEVELKKSIVPAGVLRKLVEQTVRRNGEVWRIHRNDTDPFPSSPHAHNLQTGHKLHLGTGELFLRRLTVGRIAKKDLLSIRDQLSGWTLPALAC